MVRAPNKTAEFLRDFLLWVRTLDRRSYTDAFIAERLGTTKANVGLLRRGTTANPNLDYAMNLVTRLPDDVAAFLVRYPGHAAFVHGIAPPRRAMRGQQHRAPPPEVIRSLPEPP